MSLSLLLGFIGLCVLLSLTPGPDSFLVLRYSIVGRRPAIASAVGSAVGGIGWAIVVAAGVAALLEQSATAYRVIKVIGGIYLVYLAIRTLLEQRRDRAAAAAELRAPRRSVTLRSAFTAGLLSTLLNPKVGLFYLAVLPQFLVEANFANTLALGAIESVVAAIEMVLLAMAASHMAALLRRQRVRDRLEQLSAGILAALGIGTVASAA
ncbi:LysE family translocator [Nocardia sp. CDC159]|uniref:LysE family translocator n=1 Tax=Nocardia pulmonis TaxID=2951408 RepID=A0A9X2E2M6_9NOCA|nr:MULTISPECIES: LysE family translocator [Nocardia]MCM6772774.1 LysE family translocator [Nocardia pulmonis]MCM6785923.1 LysE family translocator [Nocardia sp. CDC159]